MDKDKHVYCTNCFHFVLDCFGKVLEDCKKCVCDKCFCGIPEDSLPFRERPLYVNVELID